MSKIPLSQNVLIVGAGAHVPYGFPTSQQLTTIIKKMYKDSSRVTLINTSKPRYDMGAEERHKHELCEIARDLSLVRRPETPSASNSYDIAIGNSLSEFLRSFCESQVYSIDTYLSKISKEKNDEQTLIKSDWGRLLVAYLISTHEVQMPFGTQDFNWIQFIIDRYIKNNHAEFFKNPPKIITFNYDRFLERSIFKHLIEYHGIPDKEAKGMVDSLPIVHVYGRLNCFTQWIVGDKKTFYTEAIQNIQVIGEHRSVRNLEETSAKIRGWLYNCLKVYFLGYGFDLNNNRLLMQGVDKDWHRDIGIYSTNVGINKSDRAAIIENLGFTPKHIAGVVNKSEINIMDLLSDLEPLDKKVTQPVQVTITPR